MRCLSQGIFQEIFRTPIRRIGAFAGCALLAASCSNTGGTSPTGPSGPPPAGSTIVYTAVGASDATGYGSSVVCVPFVVDCPNGTGYVQVAVRALQSQGYKVTVRNMGEPTAVIGQDFQSLGQQYGRIIAFNFIDREMPFVLTNSTIVTIFAGGNDVNVITAALGGGAGGNDPLGFIDAQIRAFGADYTTLLSGIRNLAPSARVIVLNVPNMAGLPYMAGDSLQKRQAAQRAAVGMTTQVVNPLIGQGATIVDLMCDGRSYVPSNYSSDGMHPNDAGYAFMASELLRAITSSSYPSPQTSCGPMTVVPNP